MSVVHLVRRYDVLVVGSGGSGAAAAHAAAAAGARVLVISKDPLVCSDTKISEGVVTVQGAGSERDTCDEVAANMQVAGGGLSQPELIQTFAADSRPAYDWLREQGLYADIDADTGGPLALPIPIGGHNRARSVAHHNGGRDYGHAAWRALSRPDITYLEDTWFLDVIRAGDTNLNSDVNSDGNGHSAVHRRARDRGPVVGGIVYRATTGELLEIAAEAVILACGGAGTLYFPNTDTMRGNTGDGYAAALRAGAALVDMEQVQFLPFALTYPPSSEGMLAGEPVTAGPLGVLRDRDGNIVATELMVRTRAELAAVIARTVAAGKGTARGGCYLDMTANAEGEAGKLFVATMRELIPSILKTVRKALGRKAAAFAEPWEVRPSAHYFMGGIRVDRDGRALDAAGGVIAGLFAAGQAMGGLHGANRLGSTSLAEVAIFGRRAGRAAAAYAAEVRGDRPRADGSIQRKRYEGYLGQRGSREAITLLRRLQASAWRAIGPARDAGGLRAGWDAFDEIGRQLSEVRIDGHGKWNQRFIDYVELGNLLAVACAVTLSAQKRARSLGAHVRVDERERIIGKAIGKTADNQVGGNSLMVHGYSGALTVETLPRPAVALRTLLSQQGQRGLKIAVLRTMRALPPSVRDRLLKRIYTRLRRRLGTAEGPDERNGNAGRRAGGRAGERRRDNPNEAMQSGKERVR